jgi:FkbM family methyltransferase
MSVRELLCGECLWEYLQSCDRNILLYGTGNGGDKILDECITRGIKVSGVFASSGFVRHRVWRGMEVLSYEDAVGRYGDDMIVLLAFGSALPDVVENFRVLDKRHEFYIPDVPLFGGEVFDRSYCASHESEISAAADILADDESRELYFDMLRFRLTGKMSFLRRTESMGDQAVELMECDAVKCVIDCGAYKGDTAEIFRSCFANAERIAALEPDPSTFRKLSDYCNAANIEIGADVLKPINTAVGDSDRAEEFLCTGSRGSGRRGSGRVKGALTEIRRIDTVASDMAVDLIKMDVEGDEEAALIGAQDTVLRCDCALAVSVYHKTDDLYRLPLMIHERYPKHRLYLRREACIPAWDITLWAVPERLVKKK